MYQMIGFGAVSILTTFHRNMANTVQSRTTEKVTKYGLLMGNRGESCHTTLEIMDNSHEEKNSIHSLQVPPLAPSVAKPPVMCMVLWFMLASSTCVA